MVTVYTVYNHPLKIKQKYVPSVTFPELSSSYSVFMIEKTSRNSLTFLIGYVAIDYVVVQPLGNLNGKRNASGHCAFKQQPNCLP